MLASERNLEAEEENGVENFERYRRGLAWICIVVFAVSFTGLLGLSATAYWAPENPWIAFLDSAWRISGLIGLCLWAVPYVVRGARWVGEVFSAKA